MADSKSALDQYLATEIGEGVKDSAGQFTLSRAKALEKLAAFQLPEKASWVGKMVQAAVAGDCNGLSVYQTSSGTELVFLDHRGWSIEQVEQGFFDPQCDSDRSLQHLKQGLWGVSVHGQRPFCLSVAGWQEALLWNGTQLLRQPLASTSRQTSLTVSHRVWQAGRGWPVLREIEAARVNSEIAAELQRRGFCCPIPLSLDTRRLDSLHFCPGHGASAASYPVRMCFFNGSWPELAIPPATRGEFAGDTSRNAKLEKLYQPLASLCDRFSAAAFLTIHAKEVQQGKSTVWKTYDERCRIYWVLDGLMVDVRAFDLPAGSCSLGVVASAEGLTTDLSSLGLQVNEAYKARLSEICRVVAAILEEPEPDFQEYVSDAQKTGRWAGGVLMLLSLPLGYLSPVHGGGLAIAGLVSFFAGAADERNIATKVHEDLRRLRLNWSSVVPG